MLRRAQERYEDHRGTEEIWLTFYAQAADDSLAQGFGALEQLDEVRVPPGGKVKAQPYAAGETLIYLLGGALAYEDALGRRGVVQTGEFRRTTGTRLAEGNASNTDWTHFLQIGLRTIQTPLLANEQKRFTAAERRDSLCVIAAPDARRGALRTGADALVYSALLSPGQHLVHALLPGRRAWLHVVKGQLLLGELSLSGGDGVGLAAERSVSFTARAEAEVLLLDVV